MPPPRRKRESEKGLGGVQTEIDDAERLALALEQLTALELRRCYDRAAPVPYAERVDVLFGLTLTPAQAEVARVLYDGSAPAPAFVDIIWGGLTDAPTGEARRTAVGVFGRWSGKTSVLQAARALDLALSVDMTPLAKGEAALVAIVAPDQRASRHTLSFVKGILDAHPALARLLHYEETLDIVRLTRPDGRSVTIEARPATSGGKAVRGPSLAGVILDEAAFFEGEGYEVSDLEIYRAARPRLLPGAQIIVMSTPWAQAGLVWDLFKENHGHPRRAVVARASTQLMRPGRETDEMVRLEREADPDNAAREFDAEFLSADAERFFPEALIEKCIDRSLVYTKGEPILVVSPGERTRSGGDFAFDADSSALTVFVERAVRDAPHLPEIVRWMMCELGEERPMGGSLVPSIVVAGFSAQIQRAGGKSVVADAHYRRSIEEHLLAAGLAMIPADAVPAESFLVVRSLMAQDRVRFPAHPRLLAQLRRVRSTHKPGGQVSIHQPRAKEGGHGDIVSAMVCALAGVTLTATAPAVGPRNSLEAEVQANERRRQDKFRDLEREHAKKDRRLWGRLRRVVPASVLRQLRGAG